MKYLACDHCFLHGTWQNVSNSSQSLTLTSFFPYFHTVYAIFHLRTVVSECRHFSGIITLYEQLHIQGILKKCPRNAFFGVSYDKKELQVLHLASYLLKQIDMEKRQNNRFILVHDRKLKQHHTTSKTESDLWACSVSLSSY